MAGSKVSTKLELLGNLVGKVDQLIVGGGIANTFIAAMGHGVGKSLVEMDLLDTAKQIMADAKARRAEIPLPLDVVVAPAFAADAPATVKVVDAVSADDMILDIGPQTAAAYAALIAKAGTVVWNGRWVCSNLTPLVTAPKRWRVYDCGLPVRSRLPVAAIRWPQWINTVSNSRCPTFLPAAVRSWNFWRAKPCRRWRHWRRARFNRLQDGRRNARL